MDQATLLLFFPSSQTLKKIYQIFGTSSELSVGPVAMVSLLVPSALENIAGIAYVLPS